MYNGVERKIPFCDWKTECPIEVYYDWFNSWKDDKYVESCGVVNELKDEIEQKFKNSNSQVCRHVNSRMNIKK